MIRPQHDLSAELPAHSHPEFLALLAEVDEVLSSTTGEGTAYLLYTVGGFVLGRDIKTRLTQDIDVATTLPTPVVEAADEVALRHRMNPAWLNDQVSEMIQAEVPAARFEEIYRGRHLVVYGADDELLLALKLMSGRPQDIPDIVYLALRTGRTTEADLLDAWDQIYGQTPHAAPQRHFVNSVVNDDIIPNLRRRGAHGKPTRAVPPPQSRPASRVGADSSRATWRAVVCGEPLGRNLVCGRKLRTAPCPHHPDSPGSRQVRLALGGE